MEDLMVVGLRGMVVLRNIYQDTPVTLDASFNVSLHFNLWVRSFFNEPRCTNISKRGKRLPSVISSIYRDKVIDVLPNHIITHNLWDDFNSIDGIIELHLSKLYLNWLSYNKDENIWMAELVFFTKNLLFFADGKRILTRIYI